MTAYGSLIKVCRRGKLSKVKSLIEAGVDEEERLGPDVYILEPIDVASEHNQLEVVKYLIEQGHDPVGSNNYPILMAVGLGHFEVADYLISVGANILAQNHNAWRSAQFHTNREAIKYLVNVVVTEMKRYTLMMLLNKKVINKDLLNIFNERLKYKAWYRDYCETK